MTALPPGLSKLFPRDEFEVVATRLLREPSVLTPVERGAMSNAVGKRKREFATGRDCARAALARWGLGQCSLPRGPGGAPIWPPGMVGSISHTPGLVVAVVGTRGFARGIGVDVESRSRPVAVDSLVLVASEPERERLGSLTHDEAAVAALMMFSAKESLYKCIHGVTGKPVGFRGLAVDLDLAAGRFRAVSVGESVDLPLGSLIGRVAMDEELVYTGCWWPATLTEETRPL